MTDNEIIKILTDYGTQCKPEVISAAISLINRQQAEIERLKAFKSYFDELYGKGIDVANWHLNSELEPFDNFYESALQEVVGEE